MSRYTVTLLEPITDQTGSAIPNIPPTGGIILSHALANDTRGNALKFWHWSVELFNGRPLELDESDFKTLYEFVESSQVMTNVVKAQLLSALLKFKTPPAAT